MTTTKYCKDFEIENEYYCRHRWTSRGNMLVNIVMAEKDDIVLIAVKPPTGGLLFYEGKIVTCRIICKKPTIRSGVVIRGERGLLCTIPFSKIGSFVNLTKSYNITW